jgi:hypothetical protein
MRSLEEQWKAVQKQLAELGKHTSGARGQARWRMKRLERRTRVAVARALRRTEPQVREAVNEARRIGRGLRAGVKASAAAYRAGGRKTR